MVKQERRTFYDQLVLALVTANIAVIVAWLTVGREFTVVVFFAGQLYGFAVYELWLLFLNNFGSMFFEEGEEPETLDWRQGCIALFLPFGFLMAMVVITICFAIAWIWHLKDMVLGRIKTG